MKSLIYQNKAFNFPIRTCPHILCPYNPDCPSEIIEPLLTLLSPKLKLAVNYLRINHTNPAFIITKLEKEFNTSLRFFEQLFSDELGCSPLQCLEQIRINHVRKQLNEYDFLSKKQAWGKAGFSSRWGYYYALKKYPPPRSREIQMAKSKCQIKPTTKTGKGRIPRRLFSHPKNQLIYCTLIRIFIFPLYSVS